MENSGSPFFGVAEWFDVGAALVAAHFAPFCDWAYKGLPYVKLTHHRLPDSLAVLFVRDLLHPIDHFAVLPFLNGDVGHGRGWRGAVPVPLAG